MKCHVKRGDQVVVRAGKEKGKSGKIIAVFPKKQRAIVEGLHMIKRHTRKSQQHPNGAIVEREGSIHMSNLMKAEHAPQPAQTEG
ncbi:MAG: 50S ribosomal protein L24 [Limisphaerales bacterium]